VASRPIIVPPPFFNPFVFNPFFNRPAVNPFLFDDDFDDFGFFDIEERPFFGGFEREDD
jgi:hypothetical protein